MRNDVEPAHPQWPVFKLPATQSWTTIDPRTVNTHGLFGFILQWQLPEVTQGRMTDDDGQPAVFLLAPDGSRAEVVTTATARRYPVRQYGPQRLWDCVEEAATLLIHNGSQADVQEGQWKVQGPLFRNQWKHCVEIIYPCER